MKKIVLATAFLVSLNTSIFPGGNLENLLEISKFFLNESKVRVMAFPSSSKKGKLKELQEDLNFDACLDNVECLKLDIDRIAKSNAFEVMKLRTESVTGNYALVRKKDCFLVIPISEIGNTISRDDASAKSVPLVPIKMLSEALIVAADYGAINCLKFLIEKGADPNYRNEYGRLAIKVAFDNGEERDDIIQFLMEYDGGDRSSLILACDQ